MEMTLRWYGSSFDTVTLKQIRQIPGVTGVITTLYDTDPGEVWSRERIHAMKEEVEANGLHVSGIESVNVHDAIKIGNKDRDLYINNYIETLENLGKEDIHLVCYNFMPVFDWTRTELARKRPTVLPSLPILRLLLMHKSGRHVPFNCFRHKRIYHARMGTGTYGTYQRTF